MYQVMHQWSMDREMKSANLSYDDSICGYVRQGYGEQEY